MSMNIFKIMVAMSILPKGFTVRGAPNDHHPYAAKRWGTTRQRTVSRSRYIPAGPNRNVNHRSKQERRGEANAS